jgi:hypothetical protein
MSPKGSVTSARVERINTVIAPLYLRGLNQVDIAEITGLTQGQVSRDIGWLVKKWGDNTNERVETARSELLAKHDNLYKEALQDYYTSRSKRGIGDPKYLDAATKQLECLGRLLGQAGTAINLHAHQHLHAAVDAASVVEMFKPLDSSAYAAMVAIRAAESSETLSNTLQPCPEPIADNQLQLEPPEAPALEADWPVVNENQASVPAMDAITPTTTERKPRNRRIRHPNQ